MDYSYLQIYRSLKHFILPYRNQLILALILQGIAATVYLYWTYAFAEITNFITRYQPGMSLAPLYILSGGMLLVIIVRAITSYTAKTLTFINTTRMDLDINNQSLDHISKLDIGWHEKENAGNKLKRIQNGADGVRDLIRTLNIRIIDIAISFVGAIIILTHFDLTIALLVIVYQIIYFIIATSFRKKAVEIRRERNIKDEEYTGLIFEVINNIRSVKVLNMTDRLVKYVVEIGSELFEYIKGIINTQQLSWAVRILFEGFVRVALVIYIIYGIIDGKYEVGFLVLFYGYFSSLSGAINDLSEIAQELALSKTSAVRLATLLETPINIDLEKDKVSFPHDWQKISIKNLSFSYGDSQALSNIDFEIKRGEKIGIVGLSGAGKSTLFKLMLKEHEASEGDIYIGDTPLKQIKKSDYLKNVAAVLQETEVFNMTLKKNILLANMDAENDEHLFEKSINTSHVKDFLDKLPQGVESVIGEKGVKLSGGEKQRVGIARAIFKDPQILLLDEATSHLDVESEGKIKDSLHQFFQNITAIVIAHRLSTIREMDKIIVIEGGKIIESGNFDELYTKDARFREFWDKQALQ